MRICTYFLLFICLSSGAQDFDYKAFVKELSSEKYLGRGYVNQGDVKAGKAIAEQFKQLGLSPINGSFLQRFTHQVNTFPKTPRFYCDSAWQAGRDFIVHPNSGSGKVSGKNIRLLDSPRYADMQTKPSFSAYLLQQSKSNQALILPEEKLTWSVGFEAYPGVIIQALHPSKKCRKKIEVWSEVVQHESFNVIAKVKGTQKTDSTLYITAHYDHLGAMGEVFIPGANDNAAGVAMMLSLAQKIQKKPLPYDVVFIAFAAEEAGLLGSRFYVSHPLTDLSKIKMLINLDLVGTGSEGATVVNATEFPEIFKTFTNINQEQKLLSKIGARGAAANSDHYWFYKEGVPSFFIYTQGGPPAYHDIYDVAENLPYTSFEDLQQLILLFFSSF